MICYPEADGNIEGRKETILIVSRGASHKAFPKSNKLRKHHWLEHKICHGFKVHDLITCESKVEVVVSPGKKVSFVFSGELMSSGHVTCPPPMEKRL